MPTIQFKGKPFVQNHHLTVPYHELIPVPEKSMTNEVRLDDNLIIHGDNLVALKALLPVYAGKVKCIYIDPPYNTGTERWIYNDNVNSPMMREWIGKVVDKDDLTRHDKWLCMMMPRLKLLHELLADDGFIFVSIDHFEVSSLRLLMDEVFGSHNHRNTIAVRRGIKNVQSQFEDLHALAVGHEYVLLYSKNEKTRLPKLKHTLDQSKPGKWDTFWRGTDRPTMRYTLFGQTPETGQWRWEENRAIRARENYERYLRDYADHMSLDDYYFYHLQSTNEKLDFLRLNEDGVVQYYVPPRDFRLMSDNWMDITISGSVTTFDTEKSVEFIQRIIKWICPHGNEIILDSFAGSGTTGHAVLDLNKKDGGKRKFILVEMEDYVEELTLNRIREAANATGGSFSFFKLGKSVDIQGLITGENLPPYMELARYVFYTATGEAFDPSKVDESRFYIGSSSRYDVYLVYKPDLAFLKSAAINLEFAEGLGPYRDKKRLVFAPMKYLDEYYLEKYQIEFAQLPYEIFRLKG